VLADLEDNRRHPDTAAALQRTALRLSYVRAEPRTVAASHHNLANYLTRAGGNPPEQRAHRLAAALLDRLTGDTHHQADTVRTLARELRAEGTGSGTPALPATLTEVTRLVDAGDGVHLARLLTTLSPDPHTTEQALRDLLATAATLPPDQLHDAADIDRILAAWEPVIDAVTTAAGSGHTPPELTEILDQLAVTSEWADLVHALRRLLTGDRNRDDLLAGLHPIATAILTRALDRLTHPTSDQDHP
jgi:hypothetical protein